MARETDRGTLRREDQVVSTHASRSVERAGMRGERAAGGRLLRSADGDGTGDRAARARVVVCRHNKFAPVVKHVAPWGSWVAGPRKQRLCTLSALCMQPKPLGRYLRISRVVLQPS